MKKHCPTCKHQLSIKEVFIASVITCKACGTKSYFGNFVQWLLISLLNLGILFLLLITTASIGDELLRKTLVYCTTPLAFIVCILAFIKPVKLKTADPER
ncbi:hypothetical protein [Thalassotalea sp. PS06]|uniref:hypothetical protein n=1 Tax=Thalassotalea sp. PS06 TaxID=2594005 RepID=UPI001163C528|nr:hypothetical protein [Thalassotalea sp. PS06]QDP00076.1 hypothetical protein FNC98_01160 [Thalassotalea sp. PS06]